ncbi:hypothetical protein VTK26DRAFT_6009 [Humicola hyalothermophila]
MDLRGMLNDNGPAPSSKVSQPSAPAQPPAQQPALPSTPIQANPQQSFRDYSQTHPSPGRHVSQDYGAQHLPSGAFASPPPYQTPAAGSYSRPSPHLQQAPNSDLRPSLGAGPGPSPYRPTPGPSLNNAGGYPFPAQQSPASPVQRHQYPQTTTQHRDSYPPPAASAGMTGPPTAASYMQPSHIPQTSPVGAPGAAHPYLHRSQSAQTTPTSAHSQSTQYGAPFGQGSPVAAARPLPQAEQQQHQQRQSQPQNSGGAVPLSARPAQSVGYAQPPSPYQQRLPAAGFHPASQASPPPPPPPSLPRHSSSHSIHDPHNQQDTLRAPQPHGDRDRSVSISPKTRVSSLPSSSGRPSTSLSEPDPRPSQGHPSATMTDRAATPAKRKLGDRELRPDELERRDTRPAPFQQPDGRVPTEVGGPTAQRSKIPTKPPKKRRVYKSTPPWAQSLRDRPLVHPNRVLYRPVPQSGPAINGKPSRQQSRHPSPEEKRAVASVAPAPNAPSDGGHQWGPLGPWEASITNSVPQEGFTKMVADLLFQHVVLNPDMGEIQSRGVKFEIEAKFGTLISRDSNQRVNLPVLGECVLADSGNWLGFRSSMTEAQHKAFNEFLNFQVQQTHPHNKAARADLPRPRLPIEYRHRYEIDRFIELPASVRDRVLPVCIAKPIASKGHSAKVRVTRDQKTDKVLAKIVKARVADVSLHFPDLPLDCRISVNLEMDWDGPDEDLERLGATSGRPPVPPRTKDRLSYRHGCYQIDLTQVTQMVPGPNNTHRTEKEHELEVEVDPGPLIEQGRRAMESQPHQYIEVVEGLVNNIRILARKAREFGS